MPTQILPRKPMEQEFDTHSPFHKISYEATRIILGTTISRPTARAPLSMKGYSGENSVDLRIRMGRIEAKDTESQAPYRKEDKRLIAEAVLSATTVLGDIKLSMDADLTIDNLDFLRLSCQPI